MIEELIEQNPDSYKGYYSMGRVYIVLSDSENAKKYFQKAVDSNPLHINSIKNLAYEHHIEGDFNSCIRCCLMYLKLNPYSTEIYN